MNLENLRQSREVAPVTFTIFTRLYDRNTNNFFCFFEGQDSKYYGHRIDNKITEKTHLLSCGGKKEVKRIANIIRQNSEYNNARALYFIDRDFDSRYENPHSQLFYETPCYSIENFYTTEEAFSRILTREFGLTEVDPDYLTCMMLFRNRQDEFHGAVLNLNAWIYCQRDIENEGTTNKLDLKSVKLNKLVNIQLDKVTQLYSIDELEEVHFPNAVKVPTNKLQEKIQYFSTKSPQPLFRGKYEVEFLRVFLQQLIDDRGSENPQYFASRKKTKFNLSKDNIISELSQYADTPMCLNDFLESVCQPLRSNAK